VDRTLEGSSKIFASCGEYRTPAVHDVGSEMSRLLLYSFVWRSVHLIYPKL